MNRIVNPGSSFYVGTPPNVGPPSYWWRFPTDANWFYDSVLLRRKQRKVFNKLKKQARARTGRR